MWNPTHRPFVHTLYSWTIRTHEQSINDVTDMNRGQTADQLREQQADYNTLLLGAAMSTVQLTFLSGSVTYRMCSLCVERRTGTEKRPLIKKEMLF